MIDGFEAKFIGNCVELCRLYVLHHQVNVYGARDISGKRKKKCWIRKSRQRNYLICNLGNWVFELACVLTASFGSLLKLKEYIIQFQPYLATTYIEISCSVSVRSVLDMSSDINPSSHDYPCALLQQPNKSFFHLLHLYSNIYFLFL